MTQGRRVVAVSGLAVDGSGAVLCVRRAHAPAAARWSLPGGQLEPGERAAAAVVRETFEETGLAVEVGRVIGILTVPGADGVVFEVVVHATWAHSGPPTAGEDAADVRWLTRDELVQLPTTPGLVELLDRTGAFRARSARSWARLDAGADRPQP